MSDNTNQNNNITQVTGGETRTINGKQLIAAGYINTGNGENTTLWKDYDPNKYASYGTKFKISAYNNAKTYIVDEKENLVEIKQTRATADSKIVYSYNGNKYENWESAYSPTTNETKSFQVSGTQAKAANNKLAYNVNYVPKNTNLGSKKMVTAGDSVTVNGKKLNVGGYIDLGDGQKRLIYKDTSMYWETDGSYYVDSKGNLKKLSKYTWSSKEGGEWYSRDDGVWIDGKYYKITGLSTVPGSEDTVEPSDIDKQFLFGDGESNPDSQPEQSSENSTESSTEASTEDPTTPVRQDTNIDIEAAYKLSEFPQKFEIKYGESGDGKYGPHHLNYSAKDHIKKYITTYDYTPGQGKSAEQKATTFAKYIGKVKFILESDVLELSKTAVVKNGVGLGYSEVNNILDSMEETTPTIFRLYARSLPYLFSRITREQKNANKNKYESVKKIKEYTVKNYAAGITDAKVKERVLREAKIFITEIYDSKNSLLKKYKGYLTGKEYSSVTTAKSSKKRGKNNKHKNGIYVNIKNTEVIIDDLRITLDHIKKARMLIKEQVTTLNKKGAYNEYGFGVLKVEEVEGPLVELEKRIKNLKSKYEAWLKLVKKYSGDGSGGDGSGGSTKTPKTTPKTETPTVAPTETPTEQPTERPTEEVTQPTTPPTIAPTNPPTNPSGGGDNNNNGGGGYNYSGNGGNGGETPATEAVTTPEPTSEDVIVEGNSYKLPTSSKPSTPTNTTTNSGGGNSAIPVLAGLAAAAAAGIGAKAYIDRKNNRDNEEDGEFKAEDWSGDTDMSMEYQEPEDRNAETLDYDEPGYQEEETERYGARSNQDMENLQ